MNYLTGTQLVINRRSLPPMSLFISMSTSFVLSIFFVTAFLSCNHTIVDPPVALTGLHESKAHLRSAYFLHRGWTFDGNGIVDDVQNRKFLKRNPSHETSSDPQKLHPVSALTSLMQVQSNPGTAKVIIKTRGRSKVRTRMVSQDNSIQSN